MASYAGSTARRRKLGQLCAWGRVFAIKGLLAYLTVAACEASAGQMPCRERAPVGQSGRMGAALVLALAFCPFQASRAFVGPMAGQVGAARGVPAAVQFAEAQGSTPSSGSRPKIEVTPDLIRKTAQLAQLSFEEEELVKLVPRFESFLRFADKMQEVQDSGDAAVATPKPVVTDVVREDKAALFPAQEAIFGNMPAQEDGCLMIPKVGEEEV